jgi:hypothetical protein
VAYAGNGLVRVMTPAQAAASHPTPADGQNQPVIQGLAGYVRKCWHAARDAKLQSVETRMLSAVRRRRGEYDPEKLAQIRQFGGSEIYMMLTSNKCRAASSWLRDTYSGSGSARPWTIEPTPVPELPPDRMEEALQEAADAAQQYIMTTGQVPTVAGMREALTRLKDRMMADLHAEATDAASRMATKMEDQLAEGGFDRAFSEFIDDLVTFPTAVLKGPVVRRKRRLEWEEAQGGWAPKVGQRLVLEWERVDPFRFYPSPFATCVDDGYMIEHIPLTRRALTEMIGVEGYNEAAIRAVLEKHGRGGFHNWMSADSAKAAAEGRLDPYMTGVGDGDTRIDALQFWGSVSGEMLRSWGLPKDQAPDAAMEYDCEVWLIDDTVIRAVVNPDDLGRKPYAAASYEQVPGMFWGNSVVDLVADCQDACNGATRALMNNMGIGSGPQVSVNVQRLADGEKVTQMYPWKIWQTKSDPYGSTAPPIDFFQPNSNAAELMGVYEKFSVLADEYSGIPRYMTGDSSVGGAGRTASGMSMLMSNAGKTIKQVINNIDGRVLEPSLERLYYSNMIDPDADADLKRGDLYIVASGARSLVAKDSAQLRRNEYLQLVLQSPIAQQVIGMEGAAELLREGAKGLDMPVDRVVPPIEVLKQRWMAQAQQQMQPQPQVGGGQQLADGAPVTNTARPLTS